MRSLDEAPRLSDDISAQRQTKNTKHIANLDDAEAHPASSVEHLGAPAVTALPHSLSVEKSEQGSTPRDSSTHQVAENENIIEHLQSSLGRTPTARDVIISRLKDSLERSSVSSMTSSEYSVPTDYEPASSRFREILNNILARVVQVGSVPLLLPFFICCPCLWIRRKKRCESRSSDSSRTEPSEAYSEYEEVYSEYERDCSLDEILHSPTTLTDLLVESDPKYLDIIETYGKKDTDHLFCELDRLRSRFRSSSPPFGYRAVVRGRIPLPGFVRDESGKIWHQLATSHYVVFYSGALSFGDTSTTPEDEDSICDTSTTSEYEDSSEIRSPSEHETTTQTSQDEHQLRLYKLLLLSLKSILLTSAGVRETSECVCDPSVRSVVALQTIREMLHWRQVFRNVLSELPIGTKCVVSTAGEFSVAEQRQLCHQGNTAPDVFWLDPGNWKDIIDHACGLLAWVNVSVSAIHEPVQLLRSVVVTSCNSAQWSRICLQLGAGRELDQAIAFVDLIRFLVIRHHVPAAGDPSLFCANQFLDRAVAIPELEAWLPEILSVQRMYATGHDIDTGPVTLVDLINGIGNRTTPETPQDTPSKVARRRVSQDSAFPKGDESVTSGVGIRGLPSAKDRRVVLSVWTSPLNGSEWQIPQTVVPRVDFKLKKIKYQLSVQNGEASCSRVGLLTRLKNQVRGITLIQTPFLALGRTSNRSATPEANGSVAITNALSSEYGKEACRDMLAWLHRGAVAISPNCTAASFVPKSSHLNDVVVNQSLGFEICRQMVFGRKGHELYWLPGDGLPCFRVRDCPNGTYKVTEADQLPPGVELCRAELTKDFS